jgi:hypothetical protein
LDYAKLLSRGVGAWLSFESICNRTGLFSEKYLAQPVGQILTAHNSNRVIAEYTHPVLSALTTNGGRRPALDFAVVDGLNAPLVVVESKWAGRTVPTVESIAWDLVRLSLMSIQGAKCYFVLAGRRDAIEKLFAAPDMQGVAVSPRRPLLRHDTTARLETDFVPNHRVRIEMMKRLFSKYPKIEVPQSIVTQARAPFPADAKLRHHQVIVWDVAAHPSGRTFKPVNSAAYRVTGFEIDQRPRAP